MTQHPSDPLGADPLEADPHIFELQDAGHDVAMNHQWHRRIERVHPRWFTAAFWLILLVSTYWLVLISNWGWWILLAALGGAANYCWWRVRRPQKLRWLYTLTCGLITAGALVSAGYALVAPFSIPTESVGSNRVACGSIVDPIPADQLRETKGTTSEPVVRERPIPQTEFDRVCSNRMNYRTGHVVGATVIGLLFAVRTAGHARPRLETADPS